MIFLTDFSNIDNQEEKQYDINNIKEELQFYNDTILSEKIDINDYTTDENNVIMPGKNKYSWQMFTLYLPYKYESLILPIEFKLHVYEKAPLFTILCDKKDELYENKSVVINVWPYLHQRKFLRKQVRMVTKMNAMVDMFNYPVHFINDKNWIHMHSNLYLMSRQKLTIEENHVHNFYGNMFTWSIHKYNYKKSFYLMLLTYHFISKTRNVKVTRTCAVGVFDKALTEWINNGNIDNPEEI